MAIHMTYTGRLGTLQAMQDVGVNAREQGHTMGVWKPDSGDVVTAATCIHCGCQATITRSRAGRMRYLDMPDVPCSSRAVT